MRTFPNGRGSAFTTGAGALMATTHTLAETGYPDAVVLSPVMKPFTLYSLPAGLLSEASSSSVILPELVHRTLLYSLLPSEYVTITWDGRLGALP